MMTEQEKCPICNIGPLEEPELMNTAKYDVRCFSCAICGEYVLDNLHRPPENATNTTRSEWHLDQLAALLGERNNKKLPRPFLQFSDKPVPEIPDAVPLRVADLLNQWPHSVAEQIDRAFCNLINAFSRKQCLPRLNISLRPEDPNNLLLFFENPHQQVYLVGAMVKYCWLEGPEWDSAGRNLEVTPEGWAKYDELNRGRSNARNPVFVAMRFGGEDDKLYRETIEPAVRAAGYDVMRGDTPEHNESIMDRVLDDIRRAPFVVAEITGNNAGVYYEAGFARGLGTEVIYCFDRNEKMLPHFDVLAINQVRYDSPEDLRKRLDNRIRGSIGRGPFEFDRDVEQASVEAAS